MDSRIAVLTLLLIAACSKGGTQTRPTSEVKLAQSQHMFGFIAAATFSAFPIKSSEVGSDRGVLQLSDDATYKIVRTGGESVSLDYSLSKTGLLAITALRPANGPSVRFSGGFGLEGSTANYYFTDRYTTSTSNTIGLFWGTRALTASVDLTGDWHAFSQHVIFAASAVQDPDNVGRSLASKTFSIDAAGAIAGTGDESTKATITLSGTAKGFGDGRVDLTIKYKDAVSSDDRVFLGAAGKNVVLAVDADASDGEAGLLALVKSRTGRADLSLLEGEYWVGGHTIFVNPSRAGTDAAHGTLTFTAKGAFKIDAVGNKGIEFSYSGTYTLADDGTIDLQVGGTNEAWKGAVDQDYKTVVIVDHVVEPRANGLPELNLFLGIRKVVVQ